MEGQDAPAGPHDGDGDHRSAPPALLLAVAPRDGSGFWEGHPLVETSRLEGAPLQATTTKPWRSRSWRVAIGITAVFAGTTALARGRGHSFALVITDVPWPHHLMA